MISDSMRSTNFWSIPLVSLLSFESDLAELLFPGTMNFGIFMPEAFASVRVVLEPGVLAAAWRSNSCFAVVKEGMIGDVSNAVSSTKGFTRIQNDGINRNH